jgi:hypothetical protein
MPIKIRSFDVIFNQKSDLNKEYTSLKERSNYWLKRKHLDFETKKKN